MTADTFLPEVKEGILLRDFGQCLLQGFLPGCRIVADKDPQHRLNRGQGGTSLAVVNSTANGCGICWFCNQLIEDQAAAADEARRLGVKLVPGGDPETVIFSTPLWHPMFRQWVILNRTGLHLTGVQDSTRDAREAHLWLDLAVLS